MWVINIPSKEPDQRYEEVHVKEKDHELNALLVITGPELSELISVANSVCSILNNKATSKRFSRDCLSVLSSRSFYIQGRKELISIDGPFLPWGKGKKRLDCSPQGDIARTELFNKLVAHTPRVKVDVEHELLNLLAIIHRDGGQHAQEYGIVKSCEVAKNKLSSWFAALPTSFLERKDS